MVSRPILVKTAALGKKIVFVLIVFIILQLLHHSAIEQKLSSEQLLCYIVIVFALRHIRATVMKTRRITIW